MMYIEHTSLEDNLHHILTNRVPTSSSPSATEAAAVAASALLARVREAQNSASSVDAQQVPKPTEHQKCIKEWSRRPEPKLVPVESLQTLDIVAQRSKGTQNGLDHLATEDEAHAEEEEEEQYELLHVDNVDQQELRTDTLKPLAEDEKYGKSKADDNLATTHFVIDLNKDSGPQNKTDDEEEFEYVVTRVPKKRSLYQHLYQPKEQIEHQNYTSQTNTQRSLKSGRPVPEAIPIEFQQRRLLNGSLPNKANDYAEPPHSGPEDCEYYSDLETVEAASVKACDSDLLKKDVQMGLDILNKLKQIFNWNQSSNHYDTSPHQEGKRKRRSEDLSGDSASDRVIKYRKVENRFPKYVAHTEDDDVIQFLPPPQPPSQSHKQFLSTSMSARRSNASLDKPPLRKSMFAVPQINRILVKNTGYADIEFSDEDEPQMFLPSTSAAARRVPKVYNIPITRPNESARSIQQKPPPPLIEPRTGSILTSSKFPEVESARRSTYAEALRHDSSSFRVASNGRTGHILGTRNSSISSSGGASTSESSRLLHGYNSIRSNPWTNITHSSILAQEKENEERAKYQQLLEQLVPRLYGPSVENKLPTNTAAQRRRSGMLLAAATSSTRSSPANTRRSLGLSQSILKRPPLSSTINLDDDDEDDVTFSGISQLKSTSRQSKAKQSVATVIIDDDDISDIIDLDNGDRSVLSQCAKIKNEENSMNSLYADKAKAQKKKPLPYVEPVNSFQERISASPHIKENWLENLQSKWTLRKRNRLDEVKETVKVAEKLSAERKAAEAEIQERLRKFQIVDPELLVVDDFEDLTPEPEFVELTQEHRARINAAISGPPDQVLVSKFNLNITRRDIHTLCGHNWLNDEVINFYMNLLTERGDLKQSQGLPSVYAMNTFFVPRLIQAGHSGVKRWTRKVDIFAKDVLPVPVHVGGVHWCMAIIHMKNRTIKYYDSMGTPNPTVLKALEQYLKEESLDKRKRPFDTSGFHIESVQGVPRQMNGSDCGVFSCMFAEYITRDKEITFSQQNMEYFRLKMILEIVTGELLQ